jgi:hypothetical protein
LESINETTHSKHAASSKSNQGSLTQERTFDFDAILEAEVGGPKILSVSSTSKFIYEHMSSRGGIH